jgi:hypothetical protein
MEIGTVRHRGQLLPLPGARITPSSAANQVTFESTNVNFATVTPAAATTSPQTISVRGVRHTSPTNLVSVRALVNNQEAGKLDIAVRRRIIINVSFHFMSDNANHHTVRNAAGAAALIGGLIISSQANGHRICVGGYFQLYGSSRQPVSCKRI